MNNEEAKKLLFNTIDKMTDYIENLDIKYESLDMVENEWDKFKDIYSNLKQYINEETA